MPIFIFLFYSSRTACELFDIPQYLQSLASTKATAVTKFNLWMVKTERAARAARTWELFRAVCCKYHREMLTNLPVWRQSKHAIRSLIFCICLSSAPCNCSPVVAYFAIIVEFKREGIVIKQSQLRKALFSSGDFPWRCQHSWLWCLDSLLTTTKWDLRLIWEDAKILRVVKIRE